MKYFRIRTPLYNGHFHIERLPENYDKNAADSLYNLSLYKDNFPDKINLNKLPCRVNIKLKDVLAVSPIPVADGFIVNKKIIDFLNNHNVSPWKEYPASIVYRNNELYEYSYVHFLMLPTEAELDMDISKFEIKKVFKGLYEEEKIETIKFKSIDEAKNFDKFLEAQNKYICGKNGLFLKENSSILNYEMFHVGSFKFGIYMSEEMKNDYDKRGLTGFVFEEAFFRP